MNRQITRLAVVALGLLAALVIATTYWQTWAPSGLAARQDNAILRVARASGRVTAKCPRCKAWVEIPFRYFG